MQHYVPSSYYLASYAYSVKVTIVIIIFVAKVECPQSADTQRKLENFHALRCMHQSLMQMYFA